MSFNVENVTSRVSPRKGTGSPTVIPFTTKPLRELPAGCRVHQSKVGREPLLGETHPLICYKSHQSEHFCKQEPEGMPNCCRDSLLQRSCATGVRLCICGVGYILHGIIPASSAPALVTQIQLENLQFRRMSNKVCMMYKIMNELVDLNPVAVLLEPRNCSFRGHKYHSSETLSSQMCHQP